MFFFFKQKTAYEMRISDWSSDVCSSDLPSAAPTDGASAGGQRMRTGEEFMAKFTNGFSRRTVLKGSAALGGAIAAPTFVMRHAFGADFRHNPGSNASVPFGFNVPQTGPYGDEGAVALRAPQPTVQHTNGEGDA